MSCRIRLLPLSLQMSPIRFRAGLFACQNEENLRDDWQQTDTAAVGYVNSLYLSDLSRRGGREGRGGKEKWRKEVLRWNKMLRNH